MHGRMLSLALLPALTLSGCTTIGVNYATTPPTKAITAMASEYAKDNVSIDTNAFRTVIRLPKEAADKTAKAVLDYCRVRGGRIESWHSEGGQVCIDMDGGRETFAIKRYVEELGMAKLMVIERTSENGADFEAILQGLGYMPIAEKLRRREQALLAQRQNQQQAQERLVETRLRERDKVAYPGAQVCQEATDSLAMRAVLVGSVERVEGNRIKVFIERAVYPGAPDVSPGGFQQHYTWVNVWDVTPCN